MSWRIAAYRTLRPLLFTVDPEAIHHASLRTLTLAGRSAVGRQLLGLASGARQPTDAFQLMGLRFRNRVGLGAGFDKDGVALRAWAALGFGFVEVGTVTPLPQAGNPKPRLFRLSADEALINRMGFNNAGSDALARRIAAARRHLPEGFVVGVNIGRNKATSAERSIADYVAAYRSVAPVADYVAVNVSSPNTPGLRDLQDAGWLSNLLEAIDREGPRRPMLIKLSPDLDDSAFDRLVSTLADTVARGLIVANTTLQRHRSPSLHEPGGLSGPPLLSRTLARVERARELGGPRLAIVASGGIGSARDARSLLDAGADLVQLWTGLVYRGPALIGEAVTGNLISRARYHREC